MPNTSRSTSDTCSQCGKRIDQCVPPCPIAVSLLERLKPLDHKELRIKQLIAQMKTSAAELWMLTSPTKEEISNIREDYRSWDNDELVDQFMTDEFGPENLGWFQALSTALDVLDYRVTIAEEKESDNANPE